LFEYHGLIVVCCDNCLTALMTWNLVCIVIAIVVVLVMLM
jgi:hypothetical protein